MHKNDFIMKPKVDFCFKELMTDDDVRRMNLICVVAHESPGYVDKLVRARGWLDGCRRRAADEQTD